MQRGGRPTAFSRDLALRLGESAVLALLEGKKDLAVGLCCGRISEVKFEEAIKKKEIKAEYWYNLIKSLT